MESPTEFIRRHTAKDLESLRGNDEGAWAELLAGRSFAILTTGPDLPADLASFLGMHFPEVAAGERIRIARTVLQEFRKAYTNPEDRTLADLPDILSELQRRCVERVLRYFPAQIVANAIIDLPQLLEWNQQAWEHFFAAHSWRVRGLLLNRFLKEERRPSPELLAQLTKQIFGQLELQHCAGVEDVIPQLEAAANQLPLP